MSSRWSHYESNWQRFLRQLPGFYPLDVWDSIRRLGLDPSKLQVEGEGISRNVHMEAFPEMLEHPLDFERRFVDESISTIFKKLQEFLPGNDPVSVGCLGCPSVSVAGENIFPKWRWSLLDRRAGLLKQRVKRIELISCDLTRDYPNLPLWDAAVVDPPWYKPILKHFLVRAQMLTKQGGIILLSFPPEGTRPGVREELTQLLEWCNQGGHEPIQINYGSLRYKTPFFECNALRSAGFTGRVPSWRKADMIVFVNNPASEAGLICNDDVPRKFGDGWQEFSNDGLKFYLKLDQTSHNGVGNSKQKMRISSAWRPNQVLPSVSTSFPNREYANLISSGNRFLRCDDAASVADLLEAWERNGRIPENKTSRRLQTQMAEIIDAEINDKNHYLKYIYD